MSLTQHDLNWDSTSGPGTSFSLTTSMDRADGPYAALFFSAARGQDGPVNGTLVPPQGNWKLVGRKHKEEFSTTLELWAGYGLPGTSAAGILSFQMDYDASYSGAACSVFTLTGTEQGENFVSSPVWNFTTTNERQKHKTPLPASVCRTLEDSPEVAQYVFHARGGSQTLTRANAVTDYTDTLFAGSISIVGMHNGTTDIATQTLAPEYIETVVSSGASLAISVNVMAPSAFDGREGVAPEYTLEEEMRLKERITELEREVSTLREQQAVDQNDYVESVRSATAERDAATRKAADSESAITQLVADQAKSAKHISSLQKQLDAVPQQLAERDSTISQLNDALSTYADQIATLQTELDATRNELKQTLDALPSYIQQAASQLADRQIAALLADPNALRAQLMNRAQASTNPQHLFAALQGLQQLG